MLNVAQGRAYMLGMLYRFFGTKTRVEVLAAPHDQTQLQVG